MILIQVSLYPFGIDDLKVSLDLFWEVLEKNAVHFKVLPMSTIAWDEDEDRLYEKVFSAYRAVREHHKAVMVTTVTLGTKKEIQALLSHQ